ncbi:hypothetical protein [Pseudoalteromonas sp. MEBiC 03485]|uniref:hypothetical protein n=1 Tax=Pseudoalteromonas sp. MEBiC 03485 TaxID=2571103 RepID=UPI00102166C1|nr:hypothetical protein [Pseudoalteromonas sp. MEBiC 03485]RZD21562.1 hypothetical protein EVU92_05645 [Pseudoalteromonas sp. MEBiC 03485]
MAMIIMKYAAVPKEIEDTILKLYESEPDSIKASYLHEFESLSLDLYGELVATVPPNKITEKMFVVCQKAALQYMWAYRHPNPLFSLLNMTLYYKYSEDIRSLAKTAIDKSVRSGSLKL